MYIIWASVIPVVKIERFLGLSKLYHNRDMFPITYKKDLAKTRCSQHSADYT